MEHSELLTRAAAWMQARGWKVKLAKRRGGVYPERSRREHSLIELDVLLQLIPILELPRHYGLSDEEQKIVVVAVSSEEQAGQRCPVGSPRYYEGGLAADGPTERTMVIIKRFLAALRATLKIKEVKSWHKSM